MSKRSKSSQPGFTLMELVIAIAISAVILVGIGAALRVILVSSADSTNKALARIEVQYADSWIGDDVVQAQSVSMGSSGNGWGGFPLNISWTTPQPGNITYSIQPITDKLGRNLWSLCRTTNSGTATVAEYLNPLLTSCSLGFGTFGNVLVLNVASEVDTYSASASYTITPRAGNVTWTVVGISPYTLSYYTADGNGTLTGQTVQTVNYGGSGTPVNAVPNTGYHLVSWSDGSTANPRIDTNVTGNISVSASFAINTYTLTYTAGAHGNITGPSPQTVNHGDSGTLVTAVPDTHYHFVSWSDGVMTASRTDTNVIHSISVTANFAIDTFTITASASSGGNIIPSGAVAVGYGGSKTFTISPNTGYHTVDVIVDSTNHLGAVTSYTFNNVTAAHTISASFAINTYTLTVNSGGNGTASKSPNQSSYNDGVVVNLSASPSTGCYHFVNWTGDTANVANVNAASTTITMHGNYTVQGNFAINTYTIAASAGSHGNITPSGAVLVNCGVNQTFTISPNTSYHIANVLVDGGSVGAVTSYTFTNITAAHSISATFAINTYTLTYTVDSSSHGSITGPSPQTVNHGDSGTLVTAVPKNNYHFVQWSDGVLTASRTDTNVIANISVTANFLHN